MQKISIKFAIIALLGSTFAVDASTVADITTPFPPTLSLDAWGARAGTAIADCPSFCTNFNFGASAGGQNVANSGLSSVSESRGNARASAQLLGNYSTPQLKAESFANPSSKGAFSSAFGVQGYTYNGIGETLTLDVDLDGLVNDPRSDALDTKVIMEVVLYNPEPFEFFSDRGTLDFEIGATPLSQSNGSEASVYLQLDHTNTLNASDSISIDVATGDQFYIWAFLRAEAQSGSAAAVADAFNTGTMNFIGTPDLVAAAPAIVPIPAGVWLFGSGLVFLAGNFQRKKI